MALFTREVTTDPVTRVEFVLSDERYPFVHASMKGYQTLLQEILPRGDGRFAEFFHITGESEDELAGISETHDSLEVRILRRYDDGTLYEFEVAEDCPVVFLGKQGSLPRDVYSVDGEGRIGAEIRSSEDASAIIEAFLAAHPDAELALKRKQAYVTPLLGERQYLALLKEDLTDRQREVITAADQAGYYEWPREVSAKELAAELDISAPTLHKHLRAAERKLVSTFFDQPGG